jgi:hypothetical protein
VRIALATAIAAVAASAVDYAIQELARRAFAVAPEFEPFQGTVVPYTIGGVVLAGIAYAVLRRFVHDARGTYLRLAVVALVLSWIPDIALLFINEPGATVSAVGSLMLMHAAAAAIVVAALRVAD